MALPAKRIPESVAHLDVEIVAAALIRHDANVRNAARALGVPAVICVSWCWSISAWRTPRSKPSSCGSTTPRPICSEALRCGDPRRRDSVSMFMLRNVQRASKRGYAVAASAASLEMNINTPPTHYTVVWGKPDEFDRLCGHPSPSLIYKTMQSCSPQRHRALS